MQIQSMHFKARVTDKLADQVLQDNLRKTKSKFVDKRAQAIRELPEFEATREAARAIRDRALHDLDHWLLAFEAEATRRGATVLWARDGDEVCRLVLEIAARHGCRKVVKSKSMLSEESGLNQALEAAGVVPIETDLGEYILQLNDNEPPSHIIAPVFHKSVEQVSELFARRHGTPRKTDIRALAREAREQLRPQFLSADMG
ncbi:MAG: lactate utilization protein, partial [Rhodocyclaceae bacterium]|nr:lactate utilization protein [Rhodocyclaceae bacterium]